MKRNLNITLKNLAGQPLHDGVKDGVIKELTLATVATNALLTSFDDERSVSGEEKVRRFKLAQLIYSEPGEIDITAEEITLLKSLIAKAYTPIVVGQAYAILETDPEPA